MRTYRKKKSAPKIALTQCKDCQHCLVDVEGPNFEIATGRYFMDTCMRRHGEGEKHKVFLDRKEVCSDFAKGQ